MTKQEAIEYLRVSARRECEAFPTSEAFQQHNHRVDACLERLCPKSAMMVRRADPAPRPRNDLLDALVSLDGADPAEVTRVAFGAAAAALRDILAVSPNVDMEEIRRRAENYRLHFQEMPCTAMAMAKNWGQCARPPNRLPKSASIGILIARRSALKEKIDFHPCNPESVKFTGSPTPEQREEYKQLKATSRELRDQIATMPI